MASVGGLAVEDVEIFFHRLGQLKWVHSRSVEEPPQFASRLSPCTRRRPWILRIAQLRPGRYDHDQQNVEQ